VKLNRRQLRKLIKETLEKVDWDNPGASWGPNDQVNREREQESHGIGQQGETLIIDYRSPPSGLGTLEKSNIVIQFDGASPTLRDKKSSHFNSELESAEDYEELAQWLKTNHNVTYVRDTEMQFDDPPSSGELYTLDEWIRNLGW